MPMLTATILVLSLIIHKAYSDEKNQTEYKTFVLNSDNNDTVIGSGGSGLFSEELHIQENLQIQEEDEAIFNILLERLFDIYAPISKEVDNVACRNHSLLYKEEAKRGEVWAVKMLDASSKWPEGLLTGNLVQMGNYDECLSLPGIPSDEFQGQLCMATINAPEGRHDDDDTDADTMPLKTYIARKRLVDTTWSVCVPSTCRPRDIQRHLSSVVGTLSRHNNTLSVDKVSCHSKETLPRFTSTDWAAVAVLLTLAMLVLSSTVYDIVTKHSVHRHSLLTAFSAYSNGRVLLSPAKDSLPALHGLRMCNRIWDNLGQRYTRPMITPAVNEDILQEYYSDWPHIFIANFSNSIDTIFFLSGLLVAYNFMKERHKGTTFYLPIFYLQRYIRFTPPFAMMMLMTATLFRHIGDGPLWEARTEPAKQRCLQNWWLGWLYLNNYVNKDQQCLDQSWFNAAEMQLFWLCPIILIPLWRSPKYGKSLLSFLIVVGIVIRFVVAYVYQIPVDLPGPAGKGKLMYWPTHTRYVPWFVGLGTGYFLHQAEHEPPVMSRAKVTCGWTMCAICLIAPSLFAHPYQQIDHVYNRFFDSLYLCLFRPTFAFGLAWLVYACATGYGGFVNTFLSWSFFRVLSRTMYSFYLSHVSVMQLTAASIRTPIFIDDTFVVIRFIGGFVISVGASSLLCLTCEMPFVFMEQHFLAKIGHKPEKKRRNTPDIIVTGKDEVKENGGEHIAITNLINESKECMSETETYRTAEANGFDLDNGTICSMNDQDWNDWNEEKMRNTAEMVMTEEKEEEEENYEHHLHPVAYERMPEENGNRETVEISMDDCDSKDKEEEDDYFMGNFIF